MKNFLAIFLMFFSLQITNANASDEDLQECSAVDQSCNEMFAEKKFKYVKGQKFLNQPTRSEQVLAIIGGENDSQKRISQAKKSKEKITNIAVANDQPHRLVKNNSLVQNDIQKDAEKKSDIRTKGHYVGVDVVLNRLAFNQYYSDPDGGLYYEKRVDPSSRGYGGGLGVNYKYAFNFNKFFIAPGIFYEKLKTNVLPSQKAYSLYELDLLQLRVNDRYGVIANFGYDVNEFLSPYLVVGYSAVRYTMKNGVRLIGAKDSKILRNDIAYGPLYGIGINLKYNQKVSFNLEFNMQQFETKQIKVPDPLFITYNSRYEANLKSLKLGAAFNF